MNGRAVNICHGQPLTTENKSGHNTAKYILDKMAAIDIFYLISQNTAVIKMCIANHLTEMLFTEEGI